jgi:hypothetical protein
VSLRSKSGTFLLPKETSPIGRDENDRTNEFEISLLKDPLADSAPLSVTSETPANALILESITRTYAENIINDSLQDGAFVEDAIVRSPPLEAIGRGKQAALDQVPGQLINWNEDVKAVLKASELVAAEAEASIPPELIEKLGFSAKTNSAIPSSQVEIVTDILSASSVVGEPVTSTKINPPEVSKIIKFAIPAIGVWLCGPLLSLIDTSAVGLLSGTVQQAALNPAVAVTDYSALLIVRS